MESRISTSPAGQGKASGIVFFLALTLLSILFCIEFSIIAHVKVWRNDSFIYIPDYYWNFVTEGRWLNWLLFPLFRHIPPLLSLLLSFASLLYFSWTCARTLTDRKGALLFALGALQLPSIYSLFGWPLIPLSAYLLLAGAAFLARRLDYKLLFLLFGFLFHGTLNNFYNLLLVLFIAQVRRRDISPVALLAWYVAGFVAGYAATQLIILCVHGSFMQVAEWRRLNYPASIPDCIRNLRLALGSLKDNLMILPDKMVVLGTLAICVGLSQCQTPGHKPRERERERERERACCCTSSSQHRPMCSFFAWASMWKSALLSLSIIPCSAFPCLWQNGIRAFSPWRS